MIELKRVSQEFILRVKNAITPEKESVRQVIEGLFPAKETLTQEEFCKRVGAQLAEREAEEWLLYGKMDTDLFKSPPFKAVIAKRRQIEFDDIAPTRILIPGFIPEGTIEDLNNLSAIQTQEDRRITQGYLLVGSDLFIIWNTAEQTSHPEEKTLGVTWKWAAISEQLVSTAKQDFEKDWKAFSRAKNRQ